MLHSHDALPRTSADLRGAYTADYFLTDCGGYETYRQSGGKQLDLRLECMARLARLRPAHQSMRVLDLGCGRGEMARYFAAQGCQVDAVDYSPQAIKLAEACFHDEPELRARVRLVCATVTDPQIYSGGYDLILASDLIEHLAPQELDQLYVLIRRHLQPDGLFLVHTFPNHWYYRFGYPLRRREAAQRGELLPVEPRTPYELQMHINEQTPNGMRRQLRQYFEHVLVWAGDHQHPVGSLQGAFGKREWRDAPSLFAVVSSIPVQPMQVIHALSPLCPSRHEESADGASPATEVRPHTTLLKRLRRRLQRIPWAKPVVDLLSGVYHLRHLPHDVHVLQQAQARDHQQLKQLAASLRPAEASAASPMGPRTTQWYQAFEDHFRGPPAVIRERLRVYLPYLETAPITPSSPLLDLGCGRGDWLRLLAETGYPARGVDVHGQALEQARASGLEVFQASALDYLSGLASESLGAVTAFHLLEHLPFETTLHLLEEVLRVLSPGGVFIMETPNPENLSVGACHFHTDPTHRHPLLPAVMEFTMDHVGFTAARVLRVNPVDAEHWVEGTDAVTDRLNAILHGPRDFAVLARKSDKWVV